MSGPTTAKLDKPTRYTALLNGGTAWNHDAIKVCIDGNCRPGMGTSLVSSYLIWTPATPGRHTFAAEYVESLGGDDQER